MADQVRLYASTYDGVQVFKPSGQGWTEAGHLPGTESESVVGSTRHPEQVYVADPNDDNVIYAGTQPVHLYRSEDRGKSWEELTTLLDLPEEVKFNWWFPQPPHLGHVYHIYVHPEDSKTLYVCLEHGGIVRSFDR